MKENNGVLRLDPAVDFMIRAIREMINEKMSFNQASVIVFTEIMVDDGDCHCDPDVQKMVREPGKWATECGNLDLSSSFILSSLKEGKSLIHKALANILAGTIRRMDKGDDIDCVSDGYIKVFGSGWVSIIEDLLGGDLKYEVINIRSIFNESGWLTIGTACSDPEKDQSECMIRALAIIASMLRAGESFHESLATSSRKAGVSVGEITDRVDAADADWGMD